MFIKKINFILSKQDVENFEKALTDVSPYITAFQVLHDKNEIQFELNNADKHFEIDNKMNELIKKLKPQKESSTKVFFEHLNVIPKFQDDILPVLVEENLIFEHFPGHYSIKGLASKMMRTLEDKLLSFASTFNAEEVINPISISLIDKNIENNSLKPINSKHICWSAICSYCYPQFENNILTNKHFITWTTAGRSIRKESIMIGLEKPIEVSMRELIFLGNEDFVSSNLAKCLEWFKNFLVEFNIQGIIQSNQENKYEFHLINPFNKREITCAVVTNHGFNFSKSYNIKLENDELATTGCVGFGYERLVFCILSQYGTDVKNWSKHLRTFFNC